MTNEFIEYELNVIKTQLNALMSSEGSGSGSQARLESQVNTLMATVKSQAELIEELQADLRRRPSTIKGLATAGDVQTMALALAQTTASELRTTERLLKDELEDRLKSSLHSIKSDVTTLAQASEDEAAWLCLQLKSLASHYAS